MKSESVRWVNEPFDKIGPAMVAAAQAIEKSPEERVRQEACLTFARMYSGRPLSNIYAYSSGINPAIIADPWGLGRRLIINVAQRIVDVVTGKIAKNKPRALILTQRGNWTLQKRAKDLNKFLDGLHREVELYRTGRLVFRDAGSFGTGVFEPMEDDTRGLVVTERCLPTEILIDEMEAARGEPVHVYKCIPVYRTRLVEMFAHRSGVSEAEKSRIIELVTKAAGKSPGSQYDRRATDMIPLYIGWRLDGKKVYAIEEGTLAVEDWEFDWHPQTFMRWRVPDSGVWGIGVCENVMGIQQEISQTLWAVRQAIRKHGKTWMHLPTDAAIKKSQLTNAIGDYIESDKPPSFITPSPMPNQVYQYLWDMVAQAFKQEGVSEMTASAMKPVGLDSAPAQREFHDIEAENFVMPGQEWEDVHVELAQKEIALTKRMFKRGGKAIIVRAPGTKFLERIDFAKVDMEEDTFDVGTFPVGALPSTPAGKLQRVTELYESGFIDREAAFSLLEFPDLEGELSLQLAAIDDVKRILGKIEEDEWEPPEPLMNLQVALRMANSFYLRCRNDSAPESVKDKALRFLTEVQDLMPKPDQVMAAAGAPAPGAPAPASGPVPGGMDQTPMPPGMPPGMPSPALPTAVPVGVVA